MDGQPVNTSFWKQKKSPENRLLGRSMYYFILRMRNAPNFSGHIFVFRGFFASGQIITIYQSRPDWAQSTTSAAPGRRFDFEDLSQKSSKKKSITKKIIRNHQLSQLVLGLFISNTWIINLPFAGRWKKASYCWIIFGCQIPNIQCGKTLSTWACWQHPHSTCISQITHWKTRTVQDEKIWMITHNLLTLLSTVPKKRQLSEYLNLVHLPES